MSIVFTVLWFLLCSFTDRGYEPDPQVYAYSYHVPEQAVLCFHIYNNSALTKRCRYVAHVAYLDLQGDETKAINKSQQGYSKIYPFEPTQICFDFGPELNYSRAWQIPPTDEMRLTRYLPMGKSVLEAHCATYQYDFEG